jgi:tetratricopeptide (TPR) repeat protein
MTLRSIAILITSGATLLAARSFAAEPVRLTEEDTVIPTYLSGAPDPNPMFNFGRQSQGAAGRIYPYPLYDNLTNRKGQQTYHLVYLENEYVKIGIAPGIGGRLFSALDKTNHYDYVYQQHVIKPALIGLIGAWISGGIEWNIPHHHRASTFLPVQYRTEENADGSKTVWVGELEVRHRMRWAVGYTLRPASNVLECSVRILNRTPLVNTMLCFANVAVNTNANYQIIFPPSTQFVTFHGKREFTTWPIATTRYNNADFTGGVDVSWYKNHQAANSMFAWNYSDDFFAGYDHGKEAGTMSIADHHVVPGKKFWTWGNGPRGRIWDDILTDTDGPYVELMVGAYSDNQPDYSWLQPYEARSFEMYWYPFRDIGGVKQANLDAAVNLEIVDGTAHFGFYTTTVHPRATVRLTAGSQTLLEETIAIDPARPYKKQIVLPAGTDPHAVRAALLVAGRELVAYSPVKLAPMAMPEAVKPPLQPQDLKTDEEIDLAGQRIDQFHDADREPAPYWEEALRRDPGDTEAHAGLGRLDLRRARFPEAEQHFRAALARLTARYTTPRNAAPFYFLGAALKAQGRADEARDAFFKATWSQEWKAPAYYALAEIASARGEYAVALDLVNRSLDANALNVRAYGLKAAVLRHLDRAAEARDMLALAARKTDPLDVRLMAEQWLLTRAAAAARPLFATLNTHGATAQETAAEYINAGLWQDGMEVLAQATDAMPDKTRISPLVYYYLGDFAEKLGDAAKAAGYRRLAAQASSDYVFPFQSELIPVLRRAIAANPQDARAPYYLGNLLFDWQPAEAVQLWEKSVALDPGFSIAWRNLAQAWAHQGGDGAQAKAIAALEKAVAIGEADPTHLAELDRLYESAGMPVEKRLAMLEQHQAAVLRKDEALVSLINLKIFAGKADEAIALLQGRTFSVWEGGTRYNTGETWTSAHLVRGLQRSAAKQYGEALADFDVALTYPANLRATDAFGNPAREAELAYRRGCVHEALGHREQARQLWTEVAAAPPPATGFRGGLNPLLMRGVQRYYQALARQKLGSADGVEAVFRELVTSGTAVLTAAETPNPAIPAALQPSPRMRTATAHFVAGLGYAGLGEKEKTRAEFAAALAAAPDYLDAKLALDRP